MCDRGAHQVSLCIGFGFYEVHDIPLYNLYKIYFMDFSSFILARYSKANFDLVSNT